MSTILVFRKSIVNLNVKISSSTKSIEGLPHLVTAFPTNIFNPYKLWFMKRLLISILGFAWGSSSLHAQTFSWSGYVAGSTSYTTGIMNATVTSSNPGFQNSTPRHFAGTTVGSGQCGQAGGLALEQLFGNITTAHATLTLDFTQGNSTNGTCSAITFLIKDINSDESVQTFADWVEISAVDGNNNAIAVASITATGGSNKVVTTSGNTRIIKGHSTGSYGSRSTTSCDNVNISVTPPAGVTLKRIVIKYHPDYTVSPNWYWNFSGPTRPAYQYISIGSITATATGGGCLVLPVELVSFTASREERTTELTWVTASEENNAQFVVERTTDGNHYETVAVVEGNGTTQSTSVYTITDQNAPDKLTYYRLKQIDTDGNPTFYDLISVEEIRGESLIERVYPNPANNVLVYTLNSLGNQAYSIQVTDQLGRTVYRETSETDNGISEHTLDVDAFENGSYLMTVQLEDGRTECTRFVKCD
jgi:Secretion system C-terminal sorting domain